MRRETLQKIWAGSNDETLEERLLRLRSTAPHAPLEDATQPSLPASSPQVDIAFITATELHDLIHAAASTYLQRLSQMTKTKAHAHAERIADVALQMTAGQDYMTRGTDPRA